MVSGWSCDCDDSYEHDNNTADGDSCERGTEINSLSSIVKDTRHDEVFAMANPGFPRVGTKLHGGGRPAFWPKYSPKLHENGRNWIRGGGRQGRAPPWIC